MNQNTPTKRELRKKTAEKWNASDRSEGLSKRNVPKLEWRKPPPLWRNRRIKGESKRSLLKWYIEKFRITCRGKRVAKDPLRKLAPLMKLSENWTRRNETEVKELVKKLSECTVYHKQQLSNTVAYNIYVLTPTPAL